MLLSKRMTALMLSVILTGSMICTPVIAAETTEAEISAESQEDQVGETTTETTEAEISAESQKDQIGEITAEVSEPEETADETQPKKTDVQEDSQEVSAEELEDVPKEAVDDANNVEETENTEVTEKIENVESNDIVSDVSDTTDEQSDDSDIENPNEKDASQQEAEGSRMLKAPLKAANNMQSIETAVSISAGGSVKVSVSEDEPYAYLMFTPVDDGFYEFYSTSDEKLDTKGTLYEGDEEYEVDYDDDSYGDGHFLIRRSLNKGVTYYLKAQLFNETNSGSFIVHLEKNSFHAEKGTYLSGTTVGGDVEFSVDAYSDDPLTFRWYDTDDNLIKGANSSSYSFVADKVGNFTYHCEVTDGKHSDDFYFDLEVYAYVRASAVRESLSAAPGEAVTLEVEVDAYDNSNLQYIWYVDEEESYKEIEGAHGSSLKVTVDKNCRYKCQVNDLNNNHMISIGDYAYFTVNVDNKFVVYPEGASTDSDGHKSSTVTYNLKKSEGLSLKTIVEANDKEGLTYQWSKEIAHGAWGWPFDDDTNIDCNNDTLVLDAPQTGTYTCTVTDRFGNEDKAVFNVSLESINNLSIYPEGAGTTNGKRDKYARPQYESSGTIPLNVIVSAEDTSKLTYEWYDASFVETGWYKINDFNGKSSVTVDNGGNSRMYKCVVTDQYGNHDYAYFEIVRNNLRLTSANGEVEHEDDNPSYITLWKNPGEDLTLKTIVTADDISKIRFRWDSYGWKQDETGHDFYTSEEYGVGHNDSYVVTNDYPARYDCFVIDGYGNSFFIVYKVKIACKAHSFGSWAVTKEATAIVDGLKERTCKVCGYTEKEKIPAQKKVGWNEDSNGWSYVRSDGTSPKGMFEVIDRKTYYFNANGYRVTGLQTIQNKKYYFGTDGVMKISWQKIGGKWYYFDNDGTMHIAWRLVGSTWYYFNGEGHLVTGLQKINGSWYYFNGNGARQSSWQKIGNYWYYFNSDGKMHVGWRKVGDIWYYFNGEGHLLTGLQKVNGYWYYFNGNGARQYSWQKIGNYWYYFDSDGKMHVGWRLVGSTWYYFNGEGHLLTGLQKVNGYWYYFNGNGARQTSWQKIGNYWYYFDSDGKMHIGWRKVGDIWYYFGGDGHLLTGKQKVNGYWYYFNGNGARQTGWQTIGGKKYYFDSDGKMHIGWKLIDNSWYYFNADGIMVTGRQQINGTWYNFSSSGVRL